nr:hypothetical protein [Bordetella sp. LUAb4]
MSLGLSLGLLAGCNGEPSYKGVGFMAYNYTQFDMDTVALTDKWRATDAVVLRDHLYDKNTDQYFFTREKTVHFPPTEIPPGDGPLTVASNFDQDPAIKAVLEKKERQPGEFARVVDSLSAERIASLKQAGSLPRGKNG